MKTLDLVIIYTFQSRFNFVTGMLLYFNSRNKAQLSPPASGLLVSGHYTMNCSQN